MGRSVDVCHAREWIYTAVGAACEFAQNGQVDARPNLAGFDDLVVGVDVVLVVMSTPPISEQSEGGITRILEDVSSRPSEYAGTLQGRVPRRGPEDHRSRRVGPDRDVAAPVGYLGPACPSN